MNRVSGHRRRLSRKGLGAGALLLLLILAGISARLMRGPEADSGTSALAVPSGQAVSFLDVITNVPGQGLTYRFRFVAPGLTRQKADEGYDLISQDMAHLCAEYALPRISNMGPKPNQVVISLADRATEFGQPAPEAIQIFEAYGLRDGTCIWEPF